MVGWAVIALTSSGSSDALGNVIAITPTATTSDKVAGSHKVRGSEPVVSDRGDIVAVLIQQSDPGAGGDEVAFVHDPADEPPAGNHLKQLPSSDIAVSGDGCVGVVTWNFHVDLFTDLCNDDITSATPELLLENDDVTLTNPALSYDGRFLAVEVEFGDQRPYIGRIDTTLGTITDVSERIRPMPWPDPDHYWSASADFGIDISDDGQTIVVTLTRDSFVELRAIPAVTSSPSSTSTEVATSSLPAQLNDVAADSASAELATTGDAPKTTVVSVPRVTIPDPPGGTDTGDSSDSSDARRHPGTNQESAAEDGHDPGRCRGASRGT